MYRPSGAPEDYQGNEADVAFRQGLHQLPVPEVAADFDARVHAALRRPTPWWRLLWTQARPVLSTAACSLLVTLVLLKGWGPSERLLQPTRQGALIASGAWERIEAADSSDLSSAPLRGFATLRRPLTIKESSPKARPRPTASKTRS
jgi:hypothetical protein